MVDLLTTADDATPTGKGKAAPARLTDTAIKKAATEAERTKARLELTDPQQPGLRIRLSPTGKKVWALCCRDPHGSMRRFPLGAYPQMGVSEARLAARKLQVEVRDGADPVAQRRKLRVMGKDAKAGVGTISALLGLYEESEAGSNKSWPECRRRIEHVFAALLQKPVAMLKASELQIIADAHKAKQSAAAAVRYLRPVLKWAAKRGYTPPEAALIYPPATVKRRVRSLSQDELQALLPVLHAAPRGYGRAMLFMLFTVARREEVCGAKWADVDLEAGVWTIPETKNGKVHRVPLSHQAVALLRKIGPAKPSKLIFATETGGRLLNWDRETKAIQTLTATKDWQRHDLRRTGATLMGDLGVQPHVIEAALNHTNIHSQLAANYNQSRYQAEVADGLQRLADRLDGIVSGGAEVVPFRSKTA